MQNALHFRTTVQPGGRVEFASPHLEAGQTVDVVVSPTPTPPTRPAQPVTQEVPVHPPFRNAKEIFDYLADDRA